MKGVVKSIVEITKKDKSGSYYKAVVEVEGVAKEFLVHADSIAALKAAGTTEIEFQTAPSRDGSAAWLSFGKSGGGGGYKGGGGRTGSVESFAASYAKDTVVACIAAGTVKGAADIKQAIEFFFPIYLKLIKTTPSAS